MYLFLYLFHFVDFVLRPSLKPLLLIRKVCYAVIILAFVLRLQRFLVISIATPTFNTRLTS